MGVIADWKKLLGSDWNKTYAASNTIYVARQNNILFSVLAQFFGPDAINDRLLLIETISFTTTSDAFASLPVPSRAPPTSLTTMLAPSFAKRSACARPMPLPAPVMIATLPSRSAMTAFCRAWQRAARQGARTWYHLLY